MQHVTAACHHCVEPGCLARVPGGCLREGPRHRDRPATSTTSASAASTARSPARTTSPNTTRAKGSSASATCAPAGSSNGEAPACVQSCPHEAIAIRIVDVATVIENAEVDDVPPGRPEPHLTYPTTTYKSRRVFPAQSAPGGLLLDLPAAPALAAGPDAGPDAASRSEPSRPAASSNRTSRRTWCRSSAPSTPRSPWRWGSSPWGPARCHLGRPQYAFRGIIGLRHSWLSREILAFGLFAGVADPLRRPVLGRLLAGPRRPSLDPAVPPVRAQLGWGGRGPWAVGVFCSAMIYVFTAREFWNLERTLTRFTLTSGGPGDLRPSG